MSEKCVYLLVLSGINLRNFYHCTKQRRMQSFGQKDVAKGFGNSFRLVIEDKDSTKCNIFHAPDSHEPKCYQFAEKSRFEGSFAD